jgi:beta-glucosidase
VRISVRVTNAGERSGDEVVQLYVHDPVASVTRPVKELKGFKRLALNVGESKMVTFEIAASQLAFHDREFRFVVEPGPIEVMVGSSSEDIRVRGGFEIVGAVIEVGSPKRYTTAVSVE